jgi:hypothetical protein
MDSDRNGLDHGSVFEGERLRDLVRDVLRDGNILRECSLAAELVARHPEDLTVLAEIDRS